MTPTILRALLGILLVVGLAACEATSLMELNDNFNQLSEEQAELFAMQEDRNGEVEYEMLVEVNLESLAANGDAALAAAEGSEDPRNKVSFLNLAARSYLKSGPVGETRIDDIAQQGISLCNTDALKGQNALPVTCGYFHIVVPQAVASAIVRHFKEISDKAVQRRNANLKPALFADDGRRLEAAIGNILKEIEEIERAEGRIDNANVDARFVHAIERQKMIIFCNAEEAIGYFEDVEEEGKNWNRAKAWGDSNELLRETQRHLGIEKPDEFCENF